MTLKIQDRYVNLLTDWAFRRVFGRECHKDLLIHFLNATLDGQESIVDLTYQPNEHMGDAIEERRVVFDLLCKTSDGRSILVELQQAKQAYFKDRTLFYATWPIQNQGVRGEWDYKMNPVYVISILNFEIDPEDQRLLSCKVLCDTETHRIWYEKLRFYYVSCLNLPDKPCSQYTLLEKWAYLIRNLAKLQERPPEFDEEVYRHLFAICEIPNFSEKEIQEYGTNLTEYEDMKGLIEFTRQESLEMGKELDKFEVIQNMLAKGSDWDFIQAVTHVDQAGFETLKRKYAK